MTSDFRSCPPTHPLHGLHIPHGEKKSSPWDCITARAMQFCPLPFHFYLLCTERLNEGEKNDRFVLPVMQAIRFAEIVFKVWKSKHNFDVREFIWCRRFLLGWSLFNILGCAERVYCAARAYKQPHLLSIKTLTAEFNNPHIWIWTLRHFT